MGLHGIPESFQKTETALYAVIGPFKRLFGRRSKHHKQAHGVRAVLRNEFLRIDRIALVLGHFRAILEHHSLR